MIKEVIGSESLVPDSALDRIFLKIEQVAHDLGVDFDDMVHPDEVDINFLVQRLGELGEKLKARPLPELVIRAVIAGLKDTTFPLLKCDEQQRLLEELRRHGVEDIKSNKI